MFSFSPFLTGFRQNSLGQLLVRILPFFQKCEILFSSVFLLFSSRCAFFSKETKKEENLSQEKILFCSLTLPSHEREKEEKIHHTTRRKKRFLRKRFKSLLLLERTKLCALALLATNQKEKGRARESKELFSFSIIVLLYSKQ